MLQTSDYCSEDIQLHVGHYKKLLIRILWNLDGEDLKNARLLNSTYNQIISSNPKLLWQKNMLRVEIGGSPTTEKQEWARIRLFDLVTKFNCPNFHFVKTNLSTPIAMDFFQSFVRQQIRDLKVTKCDITSDVLLHILACSSRSLEHFAIADCVFQEKGNPTGNEIVFIDARCRPCLQSLRTLTLIGNGPNHPKQHDITPNVLVAIIGKSFSLTKIQLLGWRSRTCESLITVTSSLQPENLDHVSTFELSCILESHLTAKQQFSFLTKLKRIKLRSLRKLGISFNDFYTQTSEELPESLIEDVTDSIATFLEGTSQTLEVLNLGNCPVSNNVFRMGTESFPNLLTVNTKGTYITCPHQSPTCKLDSTLLKQRKKIPDSVEVLHDSDKTMWKNSSRNMLNKVDITANDEAIEKHPRSHRGLTYQFGCAIIIFIVIVHTCTKSLVGGWLGENLEYFIYAVFLLVCVYKSDAKEK